MDNNEAEEIRKLFGDGATDFLAKTRGCRRTCGVLALIFMLLVLATVAAGAFAAWRAAFGA